MEVRCDKCQARYRVDDARIGPQGLTMRCGKCQNTFKVTRPEALPTVPEQAPVPPAPAPRPAPAKPAARPAEPAANSTMVFGQSPVAPKPVMPAAAKPPAPKPAPAAAKPAPPAAAPVDEGAGRTMMFQTGNLKSTSPGAKAKPEPAGGAAAILGQPAAVAARPSPAAKPAARAAEPESGATMVFGQSPVAPAKSAMPAASKPAGAMMFGASPALAKPATPAKPMPAPAPEPEPAAEPEPHAAEAEEPAQEPSSEAETDESAHAEAPAEEAASDSGVQAEGAEEADERGPEPKESTFDKAPPKGLLIGLIAGFAVLFLAGGALVLWKKLGKHAPPPAAVETLTAAQADADKDTLASIASAEGKAKDALEVAGGKSNFPQGAATLARIEIQWADALNDQANALAVKNADDPKVAELQAQAKAKLKAAFDGISPALKADPKSPDLQLALADYYRAQRSGSNMNKALKVSQALKADDARVALVQGMALLQEEDGAEKAIPKLKAALAANPQSARLHFRLALAYQAMKDDANASTELKETMKLSPQHERAKLAMEPAAGADGK
jgi:predicted Zn finger-like uncharacterized protein